MTERTPLSDVLRRFMDRRGYSLGRLAREARVAKVVLHRWLSCETRQPGDWQPLLRVATALDLDMGEVDELLTAARHPP
jgi:transcriptional regulator with XRE-family HTH domain